MKYDNSLNVSLFKRHFVKDLCKEYTNKPQHGSDGVSTIQLTVVQVLLRTTR